MSVFNEQSFEKKLLGLKDSQESISTLSDWCLQHKQHHKKIVSTWLSVLKKVRVENRLTLFYLANDVIQYSKRKNYDFVESWGTALQKATTMVRHDKVMDRILRIFKIWGERNVYNEEFLTDLRGLLTAKKATPANPQVKPSDTPTSSATVATASAEFSASNLFDKMHRCKDLEDDTDLKLKVVNDSKLVNFNDLEAFRTMLKDRKHADGVAGELEDAIRQVEAYRKALQIEISERKTVIDLLQQGTKFYENEKNDAKVVFNAYRNFSSRVKSLKRKLDELIPTLSSPLPSPDVNAPSPSPDSDIDLPNDDDLSGIVQCLEGTVESDSDEDLMSIISYHSSEEENPQFSYFELLGMPVHLRRRCLPLPDPTFSDSDLTELDDSFEDPEMPSNLCVKQVISDSDCQRVVDLEHCDTKLSNSPCSELSKDSITVVASEGSADILKEQENVSDTKSSVHDNKCFISTQKDAFSSSEVVENRTFIESEASVSNTNCAINGSTLDLGSDCLPSDEDLTGLLECLESENIRDSLEASNDLRKLMQNTRTVSPPSRTHTQTGDLDNMPNCFSSFMGSGSLPFDIKSNLFADDGSNRANISGASEDEPEGKPIEVIGRRKVESYEIFSNFLNNLTQGAAASAKPSSSAIPGLGDPLPVPPPILPSDFRLPSSPPAPLPIPPPPIPPLFDNFSQDNCEKDDSWNTSLPPKFPTWRDTASSNWSRDDPNPQEGGEWMPALPVPKVPPPPLPQNLETPESPPSFEKESFRQPVEYDDTGHNRNSLTSDVDHRSFPTHSSPPKDVDHRILNNRFKKDVDHRNLISLTGSPRELQPPPLPPNLWGDVDQDYRTPPASRQQTRPGDNVESVDMEMSDEEEIERHQDKGRSREHSPSKRSSGSSLANPESPIKEREELGKSKSPHLPNATKTTPQRFNVPPPTARPPFPPPPRALFPDGQFASPLGGDFGKFSMPPIPPPPALPLSGPPPGLPLRLRHPGMNFLPNLTLPPNPLLGMQSRSPVPSAMVPQRTLEASPSHPISTSTAQQVTPSGTQSSGPEESDTDSIGQYLNMGLSDDEEIKEMVASMDPQLLQEVVDGINIGNGSKEIDIGSLMQNNGEIDEGETDWNGQSDLVDLNNRARPWKPNRLGVPGTPPALAMGHPALSPGAPRFRGHGLNWRSPPMHERGGRGRGFFRPFRGRGPPIPRQPYGGNW
ncbi:Regulation of nuclear pre-mRNA domain-containing protein 2 [Frankliniella fusca]|uniref:Regulation of nuclear pre-mRNA domain-containing protein 2 n=1 Tax=Frankliniella fusca TaxID=407009 RepID=A0AAE1GZX1_9NEOP|nr:Regulation of nuclear pre-mRNA domain-containing protein 2 [Frankliniella fusca]